MIRVQQFIKKLNNTELGKGTTHENYVLVPSNVDIEKIFDKKNRNPQFIDKITNKIKNDVAQLTIGRESRIKGLGQYYRDNNVSAGDEILFERRDIEDNTEFFINIKSRNNIITFQKNTKGFEVLNIDRLTPKLNNGRFEFRALYEGKLADIIIQFKESSKKRIDSPQNTDFYIIFVDNLNVDNEFVNNEYLELEESLKGNIFKKVVVWQKYEFQF